MMANRVSLADMAWHTTVVEQEADGGTGGTQLVPS